jgi:hypothetical protein
VRRVAFDVSDWTKGVLVRKILAATGGAAFLIALAASPAEATSTGGCPTSPDAAWVLSSLADLGITPETADGIASLDGNGDGLTCVKMLPGANQGFFIFRDNTVQG